MDATNENMVNHIFKLHGIIAMLKSYSKDERFNGSRELIDEDLKEHEKELEAVIIDQGEHLGNTRETFGARKEAFALMDQLGYHNRGEIPEMIQ